LAAPAGLWLLGRVETLLPLRLSDAHRA